MHRPLASRSWCRIVPVAVAGLLLAAPLPARAGLIVSVQSVSAAAGTAGNTLEIDLQNTGPVSVSIASFSFEISVNPASGVTFTGANVNTTIAPYIFAGSSFSAPTISTAIGATLLASDLDTSGSATLATGKTLGLGLVTFDVAASAANGPVTVSLAGYPATSLSDSNLGNIAIDTLTNGTITIQGGGVVPEPSALFSAALGYLGAAWLFRGRRAASR